MSDESIHQILEALPESNMTTRLLGALDYIVPGEWENVVNFEQMIRHVTGEEDEDLIQRIGEKAILLYNDEEQGYQHAVQIYRTVDDIGGLAGAAAMANKLGQHFDFLSVLEDITPKADTTQAIDAAVKLVAELTAFCYTNGLPGDSVTDFAASLAAYEREDAIRLAAWLSCDCIIPLGPDFLSTVMGWLSDVSNDELGEHGRFARIAAWLPGSGIDEKRELLKSNLDASSSAIAGFVEQKGVERDDVFARIKQHLDVADDKLDYLAAALDLSTNYFEHTGIQSVARRLISRAYGEI